MKKKQIVNWLVAGGVFLCLVAFLSHLFNCDRRVTIARLVLPQHRSLLIAGHYCWEIAQWTYYRIERRHQVITPFAFLAEATGLNYRYRIVQAEDGNLVGLLRTHRSIEFPQEELLMIQDFKSGERWTPAQQDNETDHKSETNKKILLQRYRSLFDRLRRENPQIPLPDSLARTAPTL